jgi:hypothetical protein
MGDGPSGSDVRAALGCGCLVFVRPGLVVLGGVAECGDHGVFVLFLDKAEGALGLCV